jgi:UDP-glucose 4-epimerase
MPWSEVCTIVGKPRYPVSPVFTNAIAEPFRVLRVWELPPEAMQLLRYGRSMDNRRYKRAGFRYSYTTPGTVEAFAQGLRLAGTVGDKHPSYRYEREVEDFFRHSPAVVRPD